MSDYIQFRENRGKLEYRYRLLESGTVLTDASVFAAEWSPWIQVPKTNE